MDVANRIALVTGAAGGIGRASALALARAGAAAVAVADIDVEGGEETAALIRAAGSDSQFVKTDVADLGQLRSLFGTVQDRFGLPAIVHNNAGLVCGQPEWPDTSIERIHLMVNVNFGAMAIGTRLAVDAMNVTGGGAIVNTASVAALSPMPNDPVYAATKAAVVMFTQSCAALRDRGIRVNAVLPGMVDTAIIAKTGDGEKPAEWLRPMLDLVVLLRPEDVARAVLSLVEDDSKAGETMLIMNEFVQPAQS